MIITIFKICALNDYHIKLLFVLLNINYSEPYVKLVYITVEPKKCIHMDRKIPKFHDFYNFRKILKLNTY